MLTAEKESECYKLMIFVDDDVVFYKNMHPCLYTFKGLTVEVVGVCHYRKYSLQLYNTVPFTFMRFNSPPSRIFCDSVRNPGKRGLFFEYCLLYTKECLRFFCWSFTRSTSYILGTPFHPQNGRRISLSKTVVMPGTSITRSGSRILARGENFEKYRDS